MTEGRKVQYSAKTDNSKKQSEPTDNKLDWGAVFKPTVSPSNNNQSNN